MPRPPAVPEDPEVERRLLEELARHLSQASDPTAFLALAAPRFRELSGCESASFWVPESPTGSYIAAVGSDLPVAASRTAFQAKGLLARWLRANEETLVLADRPAVADYLTPEEREHLGLLRAVACVPFSLERRLLSFLILSDNGDWRPSAALIRLLDLCARQAALVFETVGRHHRERLRVEKDSRAQQMAIVGQMAATVAHEVRNPLTTIRSTVQYLIESETAWASKAQLLRHLLPEVDRITETLSGMLRLSRPQEPTLVDVDLEEVTDTSLTLFQPYFDHHRLTLERRRSGRPIPVRGDQGQLRQVLLNVMLNACQATSDGGQITVASRVVDQAAAASAEIAIRDNGCGMSSQQMAKAFEPFHTTKASGTGLGLPTCKNIIARHRGTMRLESVPGAGTTVFLFLPVRAS